jgi:selenocysteine-specific elongation factor
MNHFIVATAGHVDHGKSALVKALTGTDPDRLPEEKARGITIELGFAHLILDGPNEQRFHIGIIDVPGHEDFVRNMIAGVGSVDLALLVVAADDGWMPQTEEHLQILMYLGVRRAVIALTKSDLGKIRIDNVITQIRAYLRDSAFANSPIIPTSTRDNKGIGDLKRIIASELSVMEPPRDIEKPRLFVDRAFALRGIGTVVTGTLSGGTLSRGQSIIVQPQNCPGRIRSIQNHQQDVDVARPGMRTAINLPDTAIGGRGAGIKRGDMVTIPDLGPPGAILGVLLERSPRLRLEQSVVAARPLKSGATVYVHHGTARVAARVLLLDQDPLRPGERAIAQLRLQSPIVGFLGDHFVLRDPSERFTIAGGVVLDPSGSRDAEFLRTRASAHDDINVCVRTELKRHGVVPISALLRQSRFGADEIEEAVQQLLINLRNDLAIDPEKWKSLRRCVAELIDRAHRESPDRAGLELNKLRAAFPDEPLELIDALIDDLCTDEFVRAKSIIAHRSHRLALPPELRMIAQKILRQLSVKPFDPPARKQIALDSKTQQTLRFLIDNGDVIEISSDGILAAESFAHMKDAVVAFISRNGPATVSELRQELGTSRRVLVPFLEHLDRRGITQREGDRRKLRNQEKIYSTANLLQ